MANAFMMPDGWCTHWLACGQDRPVCALGAGDCFEAFLPKPHLLLDDVLVGSWRLVQLHLSECTSFTVDEVFAKLSR